MTAHETLSRLVSTKIFTTNISTLKVQHTGLDFITVERLIEDYFTHMNASQAASTMCELLMNSECRFCTPSGAIVQVKFAD